MSSGLQQVDSGSMIVTAERFEQSAQGIEDLRKAILSAIEAQTWTGQVAATFEANFRGEYTTMLNQLQADMVETAGAVRRKAQQYEDVFNLVAGT